MKAIKIEVSEKAYVEIQAAAKALGVSLDGYIAMTVIADARSGYQKRLRSDPPKSSRPHGHAALNIPSSPYESEIHEKENITCLN